MNNELLTGKNARLTTKNEESPDARGTSPQNITVVLPAYNEEVSIGSIVLLTRHYSDSVIVIDDGSSDRTARIAEKAGAHVIVHEANKGKGAALKTGFAAAADLGADIIVTMDSDGQHNPSDIPKLVAPIIDGYAEMVNGSRYLTHQDKNTPIYRRFGQTILDTATKMNSGLKITDSQSGFRAFSASTKNVFRFKARGMAIESEMLADAGRSGLRITEVEIGVRYDVDGSTMSPIKHGLGVLVMVLKDVEFNRPLYYFTAPGVLLWGGGLTMGVSFLHNYNAVGQGLNFGPTILMILLIIVGTFMALTGVLLHSMSAVARKTEAA
ncbi:glycosyltransferase family 2 protein [Methanosarcina mazei]|uniref:Dolichyl-phosphate mannose synthase n=1 Tax=Methanosarcina mazei TaxID=2209 RepID=A0A0F8GQ78_METMZ|nr:glycosyltransferase family 2 protein [Methanosarcina mazei]KKG56904.1 dolichyl-phosphate mannose synthase [Methanosarcina mazei]KKG57584.1 dolichyl-phosphate mannose synthase [Methanosarcina mazei]KKG63409.1 dolichyl-phosphate mannose synthase [Methanosarcina mazei]